MPGFTKLVPEIVQSSIWNQSSDIRIVWITLLALKDANGYVRGDVTTLARLANVSVEEASKAVDLFLATDPSSHTPDNDGRRIAPAPGGWLVLNHALYRTGDRNAYMADYMRKYRDRKKKEDGVKSVNTNINSPSASASVSSSVSDSSKKGDARGEQFERCWKAFGCHGVKPKAHSYWKVLKQSDRDEIEAAIPPYLDCVALGRSKSQFEGWINPRNVKWKADWNVARVDIETKAEREREAKQYKARTTLPD